MNKEMKWMLIGFFSAVAGVMISIVLFRMALLAPACVQPWGK